MTFRFITFRRKHLQFSKVKMISFDLTEGQLQTGHFLSDKTKMHRVCTRTVLSNISTPYCNIPYYIRVLFPERYAHTKQCVNCYLPQNWSNSFQLQEYNTIFTIIRSNFLIALKFQELIRNLQNMLIDVHTPNEKSNFFPLEISKWMQLFFKVSSQSSC